MNRKKNSINDVFFYDDFSNGLKNSETDLQNFYDQTIPAENSDQEV